MKLNQTNMGMNTARGEGPISRLKMRPTGAFASNGTHTNPLSSQQPQQPPPASQTQHLAGPPGVPPPTSFIQPPQPPQPPQQQAQGQQQPPTQASQPPSAQQQSQPQPPAGLIPAQHTPYMGNGTVAGDTALHGSTQPTSAVPQTPAQQVLMSPADKWGLLGLLALIKSADLDTSLLSVGTDLGTMGLDMQNPG